MAEIDRAFSVPAVSLDDIVGIFYGDIDPSASGFDAPIGSLFLRTNGSHYRKTGAGNLDWTSGASGTVDYLNDVGDVNAPSPSNGQTIVWDSVSGKWIPYTILTPGGGERIVQIQTNTIASFAGTTTIPLDTSTPQITEGTQIWSQAITLSQSTNSIRIRNSFMVAGSKANMIVIVSIFRDSVCIGSSVVSIPGNDKPTTVALEIYNAPGSIGPFTYSCRVGKEPGQGTWYVNRTNLNNILGSTAEQQAYTIEELEQN